MSKPQKRGLIFAVLAVITSAAIWWYFKDTYSYLHEWAFLLLGFIPLLGLYHVVGISNRFPQIQLSSLSQFPLEGSAFHEILIHVPFYLRTVALTLIIVALARPQSSLSWQNVTTEGIDIVISLDISASMLAQDFKPNRLESAKETAIRFINSRPNDRMGLVVYEGESFTQCPLTTDHNVLINLFKDIRTGMVQSGTAIGMGLATAVNRLRESEAQSKVVILLTDGENNAGSIDPITAAEIAESYGIRVYTIGVGTKGRALSPTAMYPDGRYRYEMVDVRIDEELLQEMAALTGGNYFRATDGQALQDIFRDIDQMEKTKINVTEHSRRAEKFLWFALMGAAVLLLEFIVKYLFLRTLP